MADGRLSVAWHDTSGGHSLISSVIVDTRITHVTVAGTSHDDIYVGSDFDGDNLDGAGGNDLLIGGLGATFSRAAPVSTLRPSSMPQQASPRALPPVDPAVKRTATHIRKSKTCWVPTTRSSHR